MLGGTYFVEPAPVTLGVASPTAWDTSGPDLFLQGPLGSNYLIEATGDLSYPTNWTPILDFTVTNSPVYFTDPGAVNLKQRFYRAVAP